jgi:DNA end-binding protein Ku
MPRSVWTGSITFGLVAVPVKLYPATDAHSGPVLHQVHQEDGSRIRLKRFCEAEDREVEYGEIAKGWEAPDGRMVILTDEDFAELPVPSKKIIDVVAFLSTEEIDPLRWDSPYYVGLGDKSPAKPYALLREALRAAGQIAVTKITMRSRESLAVLRVQDDLMVLQTIRWADEIRSTEGLAPQEDVELRPQELAMARSLMETLSEGFDMEEERDAYAVALGDLIEAKAEGATPVQAPVAEGGAEVIDLMAALKSSVATARAQRGEVTAGEAVGFADGSAEPAPGRKVAAKKAAPKKAAPKETASGRTAAKQTATAARTSAKKAAPRRAS